MTQLKQERAQQAFRRTYMFGDANPDLVPVRIGPAESWLPISRQHYELGTIIVRMEHAGAQQSLKFTHSTLSNTDETSLRKTLHLEMRPVAQVAQVLHKTVPGIGNIKMPSSKLTVESLLKYGTSFIELASTYQTVLVEHGIPADFSARITGAMVALKASVDGRGAARAAKVSATAEIALCVKQGFEFIRLMDAGITMALRDNPAKLSEWKNAKRVTLVGGKGPVLTQAPALVSQPDIAGTSLQQDSKAA